MAHYFIMNIPNKGELKQIALNHSPDIEFEYFMKLHKDYTKKPFLFLVNDATSLCNNSLSFRKKFKK